MYFKFRASLKRRLHSINSGKGDPLEARKSHMERLYQTRFY